MVSAEFGRKTGFLMDVVILIFNVIFLAVWTFVGTLMVQS